MAESFDVFLSHNSRDKPAIRKLAEELQRRGLKVWLDEWELVPGRSWQKALERIIEITASAAVLVGKDGFGPWQDAEMQGCLIEFVSRELPVIPVLLPGAPEKPQLPLFLKQLTWVDLREGLTDEGLDRLQWGITGRKPERVRPAKSSEPPPGGPSPLGREVADFLFNGIDGRTGEPLYPPASLGEMQELAREARPESEWTGWQDAVMRSPARSRGGFDARDLASHGWGVVFPQNTRPEIREALAPLLLLRRQQAEWRFYEFTGDAGYRVGESRSAFLQRLGVGPGPADPDRCPYYLLLVGSPEEIPWPFQHQLDAGYAVGRLSFDTPEEYARYADTVVAAETGRITRPRRLTLFGPRHPGDPATDVTVERLLMPLAASLARSCSVETILAGEATKERLLRVLDRDETPALLFTAAHGLGFPAGDPRQQNLQGALVCQDWSGPGRPGPLYPDVYLSGDDVDGADPEGLVVFLHGDHTLGTPSDDDPMHSGSAPHPFVAHLPRRLLTGGALAVVGHVERIWTPALWKPTGLQPAQVFEETLKRLFDGAPVGAALQSFDRRRDDLAERLASLQEAEQCGGSVDPQELVHLWTAYKETRAYALLGDPAVRLPLDRRQHD